MARYQLIGSMLLLAILMAQTGAEAPRRLRYQRQRQLLARQEVPPTPYPSAEELKPEEPALIYGPPPSTDLDELPVEEEPAVNSFQPEVEPETVADAEELDENSLELTTPAAAAPARLRSSRQRLAKLQLVKPKAQSKRQRIARLEELPVEVPAAVAPVAPVPVAAAVPTPQFYYVGAQQPYAVAYAAPQQLAW
ncbi:uncharacterized protein LOC117787864 [Drosophila innubila]|uniref:uncharacterized protein LOC117787864 n=1 Tax=Drosophila innubila TaxID=198719 RepID=UPI00148BE9BE|nr:uncharacterized protein LOC117787864 [Drosophila innubila]